MPHARIDMHRSLATRMPEMSAAIRAGMVTGFDMPADDFFQAFRLHEEGELFYSPTFPNQQRDDIIFIELIASKGYSDAQKQRTMEAIVNELPAAEVRHWHERLASAWESSGLARAETLVTHYRGAGDDAIGASADLVGGFAAGGAVGEDGPAGDAFMDLRRGQTLVVAVIPFGQVIVDGGAVGEAGEFAGSSCAL